MGDIQNLNRRQFLVTTAVAGGGMVIGFSVSSDAATPLGAPWSTGNAGAEFTPWIAITPDNIVTVRVASPDIGNGVMTQAAMNIAEELDCDWSLIRAEYASTSRNYAENGVYTTAGAGLAYFSGRSTTAERMKLGLQVGASARERLKAAAAVQWKVPVAELTTANSIITHTPTGRTLKYGDVAVKAAAIKLAAEPAPKPQSEWKLLGKASPGKLQLPAIVNGSAIYGMDVILPNMVYAAIRQSPVQGGKLRSYNADAVKNMPGVLAVVTVDPSETRGLKGAKPPFPMEGSAAQSAVAVIAEHYWQARKALDALPVEWDDGPGGKWKTTAQIYEAAAAMLEGKDGKNEKTLGDPSVLDGQAKVVEALYQTPYSEHCTMEPLNGTALVTPDKVEVWHPSQHPEMGFWVAADEVGMAPEKVTFHQTYVGGGFGRRVMGSETRMVVAVAKKFPGRPVHVIWSREETMRQGRYRQLIVAKMRAGLDKSGMPQAFTSRVASSESLGGGRGIIDTPYASGQIKNLKIDSYKLPIHIMTGPYRGPGYNSYAFITETFIDECAHAAGIDPLEYRLKLLAGYPDKGWELCLNEAASKAGWGKSLPKGMGQGIAISNWGNTGKPETGTTVAVVATVEVTKSGILHVEQLDVAFDTGRIVNHDAVLTELQGGTIFGLNMALNEEMTVKNGQMVEGNYDQYPMLRMGQVPTKINIHFGGLSGNDRFSEVGEPPVGPTGPAIGNAIFRATGKRVRSTPLRKHDLSWT